MKRLYLHKKHLHIVSIGLIVIGVAILFSIPFLISRSLAVCSALPTDKGQVTQTVNVPSNGTYRGWVRMMADSTNNDSVYMQVDDAYCAVNVGDNSVPVGSFKWVNYQGGNLSNLMTFNLSAGNHTVKFAGKDPNVGIDRVMFVSDLTCVPTGNGDNCLSSAPPTTPPPAPSSPSVTINGINNGATVNGNVVVEAKPQNTSSVSQVEFFLDGKSVRIEKSAPYCFAGDDSTCFAWDSRTVNNGSHAIKAVMTHSSGSATSTVTFNVSNATANDTTAPSVPGGLAASAINASEVKLTWNASTDSGSGVKEYRIYRDGNNTHIATTTNTTYTDTTVKSNKEYSYTVSAVDGAGNQSAKSSQATVKTPNPSSTNPPNRPKNLKAVNTTASSVELTWDAASDNEGIVGYHLYRDNKLISSPKATTFSDSGLKSGTVYEYRVDAYDDDGNTSESSEVLKIKTNDILNVGSSTSFRFNGVITLQPEAQGPITNVQYSVDGKPVQGDQLDTTSLSDGKHTVAATVQYADGTTETVTSEIETSNSLNLWQRALSSTTFWLWTILGVGIAGVGAFLARRLYVKPMSI